MSSVLSGPHIEIMVERTKQIKAARIAKGDEWPPGDEFAPLLEIEPFDPQLAGPNSYDVHLGPFLRMYGRYAALVPYQDWPCPAICVEGVPDFLDPMKENDTCVVTIPSTGVILTPGTLYLGSTVERTWCAGLVPWVDGRSSVGRLGLTVHQTAGRGDDNFDGQWTCEISVIHPVRVFPGMRIAQVTFFTLLGRRRPYKGKYSGQTEPVASRMHLDKKE